MGEEGVSIRDVANEFGSDTWKIPSLDAERSLCDIGIEVNISPVYMRQKLDSVRASGEPVTVAGRSSKETKAEQIVTAARVCLERRGFAQTTVEDVLTQAGVSRSTFYRQFSGLEAIIARIAVVEGQALLERSLKVACVHPNFADRLTAMLVQAVKQSSDSPWVKRLTNAEGSLQVTRAVLESEPGALKDVGRAFYPVLELGLHQGELRSDLRFEEITEWLLRNLWSFQATQGRSFWPDHVLSRYVREFVLAGILVTPARDELSDIRASLQRLEKAIGTSKPQSRR